MRIVINALQYRANGSGIAVNLRELFSRYSEITKYKCNIIVPRDAPAFPCGKETEIAVAPCTYEQGIKRILFQSFLTGKRYAKDSVFLTLDSKVPLILPKDCHLLPLVTDLAVFRLPKTYQRSRVFLWRLQYRFLCKHADHFLAISDFTKQEMVKILHIPEEKIDVVSCAAGKSIRRVTNEEELTRIRKKYNLPAQYILFVGNYNPRKNLMMLIRAFDRLKQETDLPHGLVIAGGQGWRFDSDKAMKNIKSKPEIRFTGYVPDGDIAALYSAASLFAFPTLYEGFGIPVLEAQQCGIPVLTSNTSALPEVTNGSAILVNPYDEKEIMGGMKDVLSDSKLRQELIKRGYDNAKRFSWDCSARKLEGIIDRIIAVLQEQDAE